MVGPGLRSARPGSHGEVRRTSHGRRRAGPGPDRRRALPHSREGARSASCRSTPATRDPTPSAVVVDSQSVRACERGGPCGDDGGKKASGIKRHLLVDTRGTVLVTCVSPACVGDRDGAVVPFARAADAFPRLRHVWADQGYRGTGFHAWVLEATGITVETVQRRDGGFRSTWARVGVPPPAVPRFAVVPRRWVVERTLAWLVRCRRLSKDYESLRVCSETAIYLAMAMLPVRHLASPAR
ncbi:transposase [Streptomyces sp. NPDC085927]|uniref:transposase n=1 Tax=Streptomyces sp. NPDC085927 TaxID=3365738 RepID=UPI0037D36B36